MKRSVFNYLFVLCWIDLVHSLYAGNVSSKKQHNNMEIATRDEEVAMLKNVLVENFIRIQKIQTQKPDLVAECQHKMLSQCLIPVSVFSTQEKVADIQAKLLKDFNIDFAKASSRQELLQATINHAKIKQFISEHERTGGGYEISVNKVNLPGLKARPSTK